MHPTKYGARFHKFMSNKVLANRDKNKQISKANMELYIDEQTKKVIQKFKKQKTIKTRKISNDFSTGQQSFGQNLG